VGVVLALINFLLRYSQGIETAIRPWGLVLSLVVVGILLFTGWMGGELVHRYRVSVLSAPEQRTGSTPKDHRRAA